MDAVICSDEKRREAEEERAGREVFHMNACVVDRMEG